MMNKENKGLFLLLRGWGGAFLLLLLSLPALAQTAGTVSSYSRYGLGLLHDQSSGMSRAMGGAGLGLRVGNRLNTANPASYSAIDSLTFILDIGMNGSFGKMQQGAKQVGVNNATLDYAHVGFRLFRGLGLVAGFVPYSDIGYSFSSPETPIATDASTTQTITTSTTYGGSGGLNEAYVGLGWKAFRGFSVGANIGFLWGKYSHSLIPSFSEGGVASTSYSSAIKYYDAALRTYKLDLGAQYSVRMTRQDWLNIGVTASIGHKIAQDASLLLFTTKGDTTTYTAASPFDLPYTVAFGAAWQHKGTLLVAADVHHERWGQCHLPAETESGYLPTKDGYQNRWSVAAGAGWTPNPFGKYWQRVQYKAGFNYSTPYLRINGNDGPSELNLTFGAGIPIQNKQNNRSVVNVGLGWLRRSAGSAGMIKEDYFVLSLGVTFNERWFLKYKIE